MQRLPLTSRDLAALRVAEQRAQRARQAVSSRRAAPGKPGALARLLRGLWSWIEQPEVKAPPSRPSVTNFYTEL